MLFLRYFCSSFFIAFSCLDRIIVNFVINLCVMNQQIFREIQTLKRQILPNERLILFGSQARGDAQPNSDWDLLVLLNKEKRVFIEDYSKYAYPFTELGWNYGIAINPILYTQNQWDKGKIYPFYKNVMREGIEIS